jgi:hypothetical protein
MRGRPVGVEPGWVHGGAWGVVAGYCPGSDLSFALTYNLMVPGPTTVGVPGDPGQPGLLDRLALIVQRAAQADRFDNSPSLR